MSGARNRLARGSEAAQSAPLPADVFDAITDALADALVADYLHETGANLQPAEPMVNSPSGMDRDDHAA